jgi:sphingomyelin phosphodiesterase
MERDPAGLFAWMVSELEAAEAAGERVWLMGKSSYPVEP